jgi:hypothetical protein
MEYVVHCYKIPILSLVSVEPHGTKSKEKRKSKTTTKTRVIVLSTLQSSSSSNINKSRIFLIFGRSQAMMSLASQQEYSTANHPCLTLRIENGIGSFLFWVSLFRSRDEIHNLSVVWPVPGIAKTAIRIAAHQVCEMIGGLEYCKRQSWHGSMILVDQVKLKGGWSSQLELVDQVEIEVAESFVLSFVHSSRVL